MKSFIIYNPIDSLSKRLANECLTSCKNFNLTPVLVEGCFGEQIEKKENFYNLTPSRHLQKIRIGERGCFISHFELWHRCLELNETILILEHDAIMKNKLNENIESLFEEILHLDHCSSLRKNMKNYSICNDSFSNTIIENWLESPNTDKLTWQSAKKFNIPGAHAYLIKPIAAKKLIDYAKRDGFLPADVHINLHYVNIKIVRPCIFRINEFMVDEKNRKKYSSTKGYIANGTQ